MQSPALAQASEPMFTPQVPLRLEWRLTWSDAEDDFSAVADGYEGFVGRIYKDGGQSEAWAWSMTAHGYDIARVGELHGCEADARDAAHMVEAAWFRAVAGSRLAGNAYAAAKGR